MNPRDLAKLATQVENSGTLPADLAARADAASGIIIGITGPPGAGKSTLAGALTAAIRKRGKTVAIVAVDPSSRATGGAILGDRIRLLNHNADPGVFVRSMATRGAPGGLARSSGALARLFLAADFDFVILETIGAGQDEIAVASHADVTLVVLIPGAGDDIQAIKAGMMEIADIFVVNKADLPGADQAENEIGAMLSLQDKNTRPPVLRTVAADGTGIPALLDAIEIRPRRARLPATPDPDWLVDHIGIAVVSLDESLAFYTGQMGMKLLGRESVAAESVNVAMLDAGPSRIELLEPTSPDSAIARFLAQRGPGIHHIAMRVPHLNSVVERLKSSGARVLNEPRAGAGGHLYVFVHPASSGGVLWEIIQDRERSV